MVYLLGLLLIPLSFLYSPSLEKKKTIYFTQTMSISQERNSPAYILFKEAKKINLAPVAANNSQVATPKAVKNYIYLSTDQSVPLINVVDSQTPQSLETMTLTKQELMKDADQKLAAIAIDQKNSTLLNSFQNTTTQQLSTPQKGIIVRGSFELSEGVGITDHIVSLYRVVQGQSFEVGQVDLRAGLYQIVINSFEGELVAEIKDKSGYLIGEDRESFSGLKQLGTIFQGPSLKLGKPTAFALNPRFADDRKLQDNNNNLQASLFSGNFDLKKTNEDYPNVSRQSSTVGFIHDPNEKIANTLTLRSAKDDSETVLFSKLWVKGAVQYAAEKLQIQYAGDSGIIIGRVVENGRPVADVSVVLDNFPGVEVFYLDDFWIPQLDNQKTSKNGYFFIPGLTRGSYQISAQVNNLGKGSRLFVVDDNTVGYQEIAFEKNPAHLNILSFDAFTSAPMGTELAMPGSDEITTVSESGQAREKVSFKSGIQEIVNRPSSREHMTYTYLKAGAENYLHLPQISEKWIDDLAVKSQISISPEKSFLILFISTPEFTVTLADGSYNNLQRVFFDPTGAISSQPTNGGGVIFFNVPEGLQEVVLHESETLKVHSKAFFSKPGRNYLSVFRD